MHYEIDSNMHISELEYRILIIYIIFDSEKNEYTYE